MTGFIEGGYPTLEGETFFGRSKFFLVVVLLALFGMGLAVRLVNLTNPPLDFHSTRQLRSAIIARSLYYRLLPDTGDWYRQQAIGQFSGEGIIEPPVFESLVAVTYRMIGSDPVWVARLYAILFWIAGGLALYFLASAMTSPDGGVAAVAYYLFVPFGVIASRSFQPDPLMVMFILLALLAVYKWNQRPSWARACLAGGLIGFALFIKAVAVFPVLFALAAFFLVGKGMRGAFRDPQLWTIAMLGVLPMLAYHVYGVYILGTMESQFSGRFFPEMWRSLSFYFNWEDMASGIAGYGAIFLALIGTFLFRDASARAFGVGLWLGYFAFGMTFPYHFTSHNYYHLPLIAIVAITLAPVGALVFKSIAGLKPGWLASLAITGIFFSAVVIQAWDMRLAIGADDYRHEPAYWAQIGEILGHDSSVIGLTQDYGNRLAYYGWITPKIWPALGQQSYRQLQGKPAIEVQNWFAEKAGNRDFFLVTMLNQLDRQPELKELLYDNYPVYAEGEGYIIFDLRNPIVSGR